MKFKLTLKRLEFLENALELSAVPALPSSKNDALLSSLSNLFKIQYFNLT